MKNIQILKKMLKDTASQIRIVRFQHKQAQKAGLISTANGILFKLLALQYDYRHCHIAYCELRGRTRLQIEKKIRKHNEPNESYIRQIKEIYAWTPEEIKAYEERNNAKTIRAN